MVCRVCKASPRRQQKSSPADSPYSKSDQTLQPGLVATGSLPRWNQRLSPASSAAAYLASGSAAAAASTAATAAATSSGYSGAAAFFPRLRGLAGALLALAGPFFAGLFFAASAGGLRAARTHMHALLLPGARHEAGSTVVE